MSYQVGVDVGGTFTTTAVVRGGRAEVVSVVPTELPGVPRGFLRRIGDDTPVLVGTRPVPAETLVAQLVSQSVAKVGTPASLAVTHPVTWGPHRVAALRAALGEVTMLSSAAAIAYQSQALTAVHDLGGTTFTAAMVRGLATVGQPIELDLGGADLDELVFEHVRTALGETMPTDAATLTRLRKSCTAAKETLSADTEAEIPVANTRVRLTRAEFEEMARPLLTETAVALRMTIEESGVTPATVLLAGGAAWLPLLTQVVSEELGRPVVATPPGAAAMGAALAAAGLPAGPAFRNQAGAPGAGRPAALRPDTPSATGASGLSVAAPQGNAAFAASRPANPGAANPNTAGESDPSRGGALPYGAPSNPNRASAATASDSVQGTPNRATAPFGNPSQPNPSRASAAGPAFPGTATESNPAQGAPNRATAPFAGSSQPNPNRAGVAGLLTAASGPASPSATSTAGPGAATDGRANPPTRLAVSFEPLPGNGSAFAASNDVRTSVVEPVRPPVPFTAAPADGRSRRPRTMVAVAAAAFVLIGAASAIMLTSGQTPPGAGAETMPTTTTVTQTVSATTTDTPPPAQTSTRQAPPSTRKTTPRPTTTTTKPAPTTTSSKAAPTTTTGNTTSTTTANTPANSRAPQTSQGGDN